MDIVRERLQRDHARDAGLSLVEVIVAIAIISVIALSSATLTINGIAMAATQQRKQVAVTIASGTMETVSARSVTVGATGVSALYAGRYQSDVQNAWTANSTVDGIAQTYATWDTTATSASTVARPTSVTRNGTTFAVTTLIGNCYQPKAGDDCGKPAGYPTTAPTTVPADTVPLIRVIVVVSWTAGTCTADSCRYTTSTLIDPHKDLEWVTHD